MANVKFNKGLLANLPATSTEGALYFTTDESIYLGLAGGGYHRFGDFIEVANVAALPADGAHVKALYYAKSENVLCKWDGSAWVQINLNTTYTIAAGATAGSVKLVGSDNSSVEVQVVDVAGLNSAISAADAKGAQGIADAATAQAKGEEALAAAQEVATLVGELPAETDAKTVVEYVNAKTSGIATDAALGELQGKVAQAESDIDALETKVGDKTVAQAITDEITALNLGTTYEPIGKGAEEAGKVQDALDAYIESNNAEVAKKANSATTLAGYGITDAMTADEIAQAIKVEKDRAELAEKANADAAAEALAEAQKKVASVGAGDASVTVAGTSTAPTVAVKLDPAADNAIKLGENGLKVEIGAAPEYSIVKAAESGEYAAVYNLTKDGAIVGASINIPKDLVVKSGSVVDGNIVLVLNDEANTEIVIPADSLIEYVTSGSSTSDMVVINVSDDHKVTATITDGTIGLTKLTTELQTEIGKAHVHENKSVLDGITADDVEAWRKAKEEAIAEAGKLDAAMDLRMDAVEEKLTTVDEDADVNVIETVKVNGIALTPDENKAVDVTVPTGTLASKDKVEETDLADELKAKVHTHDNKALLDTYTQTEENLADAVAKKHEHANAEELAKIVSGDKAKWDEAATKASDNETAIGGVSDRVTALEEIDHDAYVAADEVNLKAAKDYCDQSFQWGEF